jgi:hypothetical protein
MPDYHSSCKLRVDLAGNPSCIKIPVCSPEWKKRPPGLQKNENMQFKTGKTASRIIPNIAQKSILKIWQNIKKLY